MVKRVAFAQIGPFTTVLEAVATAVGAGVVLGTVTMGVIGLALRWPRAELERRALSDGYVGGAVGALVVLWDVALRYG